MAGGLQVWDETGALIFDETTPVIKFLGSISIGSPHTGGTRSGSVTDARFTQFPSHVGFWCRVDGLFSTEGNDATWQFNGNTLTWTYPKEDPGFINGYATGRPPQTIVYGIR